MPNQISDDIKKLRAKKLRKLSKTLPKKPKTQKNIPGDRRLKLLNVLITKWKCRRPNGCGEIKRLTTGMKYEEEEEV